MGEPLAGVAAAGGRGRVLIIRSVSVQQLDGAVSSIRDAFPGYSLSVLTHEHGIPAVSKYPWVERVYGYRERGPFRFGRGIGELAGERFEAVVVPVANPGRGGYFNVFWFSFSIRAGRRVVLNSAGKVDDLNLFRLVGFALRRAVITPVALLLSLPVVCVISLGLPWLLRRMRAEDAS